MIDYILKQKSKSGLFIFLAFSLWSMVFSINYVFASNENTGTKRMLFTKLFGGVRPASVAGAFIAICDDANAIYYNPAGLSQLDLYQLSSSYSTYLAGISFGNIVYILPYKRTTLGFALDYLNIGAFEETTRLAPTGTGKSINPFAFEAITALSQRLAPNLSVGCNLKLMGERTIDDFIKGYGLDAGILYSLSDTYTVGFVGKNIMGKYAGSTQSLSSNYGLGVSFKYRYAMHQFLFDVDANLPNDNKLLINFGGGYNFRNKLFLRAGFNTRAEENAGGNLGLGIGIRFTKFSVDYAFVPYGDLGMTHRFAVNLNPVGEYIPRLSEIIASPSNIRIEVGQNYQIKTEGRDERGNFMGINPILKVWGAIGKIDKKTGIFTATRVGSGKIQAYLTNVTIDNRGNKINFSKTIEVVVFPKVEVKKERKK